MRRPMNTSVASRAWRRLLPLGVGASLLAACGGGGGTAADASASATGGGGDATDEITFLNVTPIESLSWTPEMYAACSGLFEEQGLDVRFEATQGSAPALNTIVAGGALLTRTGDIETISAIATQEAPLVVLGVQEKQGGIWVMSAEAEPLEEPEDFVGKIIGLPALGGGAENQLDLMLSASGIEPSEVERQVTGLAPGVFELVDSGRIDGYMVATDVALALQAQRPNAVAMKPSDFMPAGAQGYVTSQEQVEHPEKAEQIRRYLQASAEATRFIAEDETNDFQQVFDCISSEFDVPALAEPDAAQETLSVLVDSWTVGGTDAILQIDSERWADTYEAMVGADLVPGGLDPQEWATDEFAPDASE